MSSTAAKVIVGAGLAGAKAAETLRDEGFDGPVVLIGDEAERPYERPPLSKDFLMGKAERDSVFVHPADWYAEHDVDLRLDTTVTAIDRASHQIELAGGGRESYDKLLLTTGSSPRRLDVPGAGLRGVHYLRRLGDSEQIKTALQSANRAVVIGGGWIGLECAAAARTAGVDVALVEMAELPLLRVLGREVAEVFADLHRANGVELRLGVQVDDITGRDDQVNGVLLADGTQLNADLVIVGVGITPNTALAEAAGLDIGDGVRADASLSTSDPDIYVAGDVADAYHPFYGRHLRVEHWANALNQPQTAAKAMLGQEVFYDLLPYFYTDQYDLGMEYSGYVAPGGYDQVVFRGDGASQGREQREFIAFWLHQGHVLAGMNVNVWDVTDDIQALIRPATRVDPDRLANPDIPLTAV
jgi:3-phenylpropionate/trans-cinnamate dioxygenase ferredoxin reductase component